MLGCPVAGQMAMAFAMLVLAAIWMQRTMVKAEDTQAGNLKASFVAIIGGVLVLVVGLVLSTVILSQAATSGASVNIGSFSGAQSLNDLIPLMYYAILVLFSVSLKPLT